MLGLTPALTHLGVRHQQFTPCLPRPDCCLHVADLGLEFGVILRHSLSVLLHLVVRFQLTTGCII